MAEVEAEVEHKSKLQRKKPRVQKDKKVARGKGNATPNCKWSPEDDAVLVQHLLDSMAQGIAAENAWKDEVYKQVAKLINAREGHSGPPKDYRKCQTRTQYVSLQGPYLSDNPCSFIY